LLTLATDSTDRTVQRSGIGLLTRTVVIWATNPSVAALPNCGVFASSEAAANPARQVTKRSNGVDGKGANGSLGSETSGTMTEQGLLGYEQVVYDRITPALFQVIMSEGMKMKDGQSQLVSVLRGEGLGGTSGRLNAEIPWLWSRTQVVHEVATFLREVVAARGQEGIDVLSTRTLPALNCPHEAAGGLMARLTVESMKDFRKTFLEFVKAWRAQVYPASR
jgi:hypothetical protein